MRTSNESHTANVVRYIQEGIPEASVREEHNKMIHFRVSTNVPLHRMFSVLEKARDDLQGIIEDYTVTQVTLDDVFVNFAKVQADNEESEQPAVKREPWWKRSFLCKLFYKSKGNAIGKSRIYAREGLAW